MAYRNVLVIGGTGFIGSHIIAKLVDSECRVTVPTRREGHATHLLLLPDVELVVEGNVHDDAVLDRLMHGQDAVINLVGILHGRPGPAGSRYGRDFERAHVELPKRIVAACARNGVHRLLHMSALGVSPDAPSMYLRSKADGEAAAMSDPAVHTTIFRPSVVFGDNDRFLNMFASLQRMLPLMMLAGADARFQPVYVEDVARAFVIALQDNRTIGKVYELAGPKVYTLRELVRLAGEYSGHRRPVIGVPDAFARLQAFFLEHMPGGPLMSRDNLDSMQVDNVRTSTLADELGIQWTPIEAIAPNYLRGRSHYGAAAA
ncbi:complex I NDUFA9 subunit family protein [Noviherbaspirillum denitrificans]|uniref:NAD-dependent dehydratase n=1 Tax=Noviherbaspirillum denitrificans TaxID=1968433 RepID=A0A254T8A7_9BURK|nr:complex I NDUFA9 subunit family protein [Noviherbaspirillum denitrificans]OWW18815.1 NAD-dependent dehydratase [Noviherbaspirillum denitrificans]